jgi:heme-degrading monooxygenase HmoA
VIQFQVRQKVNPDDLAAFEKIIRNSFIPAISHQEGFVGFRLLYEYPEDVRAELGATSDGFHVVVQLTFDTEDHRQTWVKTDEHEAVGQQLGGVVKDATFSGYTIVTETGSPT